MNNLYFQLNLRNEILQIELKTLCKFPFPSPIPPLLHICVYIYIYISICISLINVVLFDKYLNFM